MCMRAIIFHAGVMQWNALHYNNMCLIILIHVHRQSYYISTLRQPWMQRWRHVHCFQVCCWQWRHWYGKQLSVQRKGIVEKCIAYAWFVYIYVRESPALHSCMQQSSCQYNSKNAGATATGVVKIASGSESDLMSAVASGGPVAVAVDASVNSFMVRTLINHYIIMHACMRVIHACICISFLTCIYM